MKEGDLEDLRARIGKLEDLEEIRNLRFEYHRRINEGEFDRICELYTEDALVKLDYLSSWRGRDEINAGFTGIPGRSQFIKQFIHNHVVELSGADATGCAYFEARYVRSGTSLMVAGKYDESYRRQDGRWLIATTVVTLYFSVPVQPGWAGAHVHHLTSTSLDSRGTSKEVR